MGRAPEAITPALFVNVRIDRSAEAARRTMDAYTRANYGLPLTETERIQAFALGTPQEVATKLARYTAAGARHLVARLGALEPSDQLEQLDRLAAVTHPGSR